jgi:hypothetical protein
MNASEGLLPHQRRPAVDEVAVLAVDRGDVQLALALLLECLLDDDEPSSGTGMVPSSVENSNGAGLSTRTTLSRREGSGCANGPARKSRHCC